MQHGAGKGKGIGTAELGQFGKFCATGVGQAEQFGGFIEGFAGGVVHAFAEQFVVADAAHGHELGVAAGYEQGNEGKVGLLFG